MGEITMSRKLHLTWGRFFKYPECCIAAFISKVGLSENSPYNGTGFRPCCMCARKVEGMSIDKANETLGINVKFEPNDVVRHTLSVIERVQSPDWLQLATKLGWTVKEYNNYLDSLGAMFKNRQALPTLSVRRSRNARV